MLSGQLIVLTRSVVEQLCPKYRGGTFDVSSSSTWKSLGDWQLSFPYTDVEANGNYGLDTLVIQDSQTDKRLTLDKALITSFTSTDYYNGFFGLGIISGEFGDEISDSPFSQMVADYGWFPSYTYGFTAGAYYSMDFPPRTVPVSLGSGWLRKGLTYVQRDPGYRRRWFWGATTRSDSLPMTMISP